MKLRLIEQACGCSAVRGGGGLNMAGCALARHLQTWLVFVFSTAVSKFERVNSCVEARNPQTAFFDAFETPEQTPCERSEGG